MKQLPRKRFAVRTKFRRPQSSEGADEIRHSSAAGCVSARRAAAHDVPWIGDGTPRDFLFSLRMADLLLRCALPRAALAGQLAAVCTALSHPLRRRMGLWSS